MKRMSTLKEMGGYLSSVVDKSWSLYLNDRQTAFLLSDDLLV